MDPQSYLVVFLAFLAFRLSFALVWAFFCVSRFPLSLLPLSAIRVSPCLEQQTRFHLQRLTGAHPDVTLTVGTSLDWCGLVSEHQDGWG